MNKLAETIITFAYVGAMVFTTFYLPPFQAYSILGIMIIACCFEYASGTLKK